MPSRPPRDAPPRTGVARALSKLGYCSREQAYSLVDSGRVRVNGVVARDRDQPVWPGRDRLEVDGSPVEAERRVYLALNKPRGLVTTVSDERGRPTVFECLLAANRADGEGGGPPLPRVSPVGRLDKASEGLLLFSNDTGWAARVTAPGSHLEKTYHVHIDRLADETLVGRMLAGVVDAGESLSARRVAVLRQGGKNSWLEVVLDEGKNRHIRRLLAALGVAVLRLMRVAVGPVLLGDLPKGRWRPLTAAEVATLAGGPRR